MARSPATERAMARNRERADELGSFKESQKLETEAYKRLYGEDEQTAAPPLREHETLQEKFADKSRPFIPADVARKPAKQSKSYKELSGEDKMQALLVFFLAMTDESNLLGDLLAAILGFDTQDDYLKWREEHTDWNAIDIARNFNYRNFDFNGARNIQIPDYLRDSMNPLLDLIAEHESGGNYNAYFGHANNQAIQFTNMTINQVLDWQDHNNPPGPGTAAVGRYQFINPTLEGLVREMGLSGNERFDEPMQDRLALTLLERRGYSKFLNNEIDETQFMKNLSMEWAALPKDYSGRSYYAGDGVNKAHASVNEVMAAIKLSKDTFRSESEFAMNTDGVLVDKRGRDITEVQWASKGYCGRGVHEALGAMGINVPKGNGEDWYNNLSRSDGWMKLEGVPPEAAPPGAVLCYDDRNMNHGGGGKQHGHVEMVAYGKDGDRQYVSDKARDNFGGTVPDRYQGAFIHKSLIEQQQPKVVVERLLDETGPKTLDSVSKDLKGQVDSAFKGTPEPAETKPKTEPKPDHDPSGPIVTT